MRRIPKVDGNQPEIVEVLRNLGASVQSLAPIGSGCPDLVVGYKRRNWLFEVKQKAGKLTPDQITWHSKWLGQVCVIHSVEQALDVITMRRRNI